MRLIRIALAVALVLGCGGKKPLPYLLPSPVSPPPKPRTLPPSDGGLYAGFGRADLTAPPTVALAGNGFEGLRARGYRYRLYARAMVLEDEAGQRIAFVVADLPHMSPVLHRLAANRLLAAGTGIGADRLIVSATHTHASIGNFYEASQYNQQSAPVPGYDTRTVDFVASAFVQAVMDAIKDLQPATASWATARVSGLTWNRSFDAFRLNQHRLTPVAPGTLQDSLEQAVDRTWSMLRVRRCYGVGWTDCLPLGAFSIFAIHGTGNPPYNDLMDGDFHAIAARALERHIESRNPHLTRGAFRSGAFHLFANGTEGDVSPRHTNYSPMTDCAVPRLQRARRPAGPRTPPAPEEWRHSAAAIAACVRAGRVSTNRIGDALGAEAVALFDAPGTFDRHFRVRRAFTTLDLTQVTAPFPLCEARSGTATLAGAEDGRLRTHRWRFFWLTNAGYEEGGAAVDRNTTRCGAPKRLILGQLFQRAVVNDGGLPWYAQLALVQLGDRLVASVPAELTTEAGMRIKRRIGQAAPAFTDKVAVLGLANGYFQYVTTHEEYAAQHYEGGSNLYGANTARALGEELAALAASLGGMPTVSVAPIDYNPGRFIPHFPPPTAGPKTVTRRFDGAPSCTADRFVQRWFDVKPGVLIPARGPVVAVEHEVGGATTRVVDDHRFVEVRFVRHDGDGAIWEIRLDPQVALTGRVRAVLLARPGFFDLTGAWTMCP